MTIDARTPILIGAGQVVSHWDGVAADAPSPLSLAVAACRAAFADTGIADTAMARVDRVIAVRSMLDSVPGAPQPFGRCANPPGTLAAELGLTPARAIYSVVGGDQPQALVNESAEAIHAGDAAMVVIAGAEATGAMKLALKKRIALDWSTSVDGNLEDRGRGGDLLTAYELRNGLGAPTQTYPIFEHALRARLGHDNATHMAAMSELWEGFSRVAAANPYAQFREARTRDFLATPSAENYPVADPYLKWHVAQDAVNQGAAVIMTSAGTAVELGIDPSRWIHLHGYAQAKDHFVTERADLSRSQAMSVALTQALAEAGRTTQEITYFDLYSCFPCAVLLAAEALGLNWRETPATVTGGLPFFGGAGNNYSLHAIAEMMARLRADPGAYGLVLANGGFLSKEAVGIYSTTPRTNWRPMSSAAIQATIDATNAPRLLTQPGEAVIESYTVTARKGAPDRGYVLARMAEGRILARACSGHRATLAALIATDPIGRRVEIVVYDGVNIVVAPDRIGKTAHAVRHFNHVRAERRGHVLEVTLDRPGSMNALHSAAHFELHEIWDEFERDSDLWVGIITGAGDRAFCSGNDLKVTARGGDMAVPPSGFGGLCARLDRQKPIIAAVNGIAMGGGLEIALACDMIVADCRARLALPEVKVGLFAAAGGVQRLTRQIGRKAAMGMILTGRPVDAAEALRLGIVNEVVDEGMSVTAARALADIILGNSPSAIRASKRALNALDRIEDLEAALIANGAILGDLLRSQDMREGVTAFAEKRAPKWVNA